MLGLWSRLQFYLKLEVFQHLEKAERSSVQTSNCIAHSTGDSNVTSHLEGKKIALICKPTYDFKKSHIRVKTLSGR